MRQDDSVLQIILGCENQSEIDYSMPIRTMLYDALKYTEQQNNLELRKRKDGTYYHSKLRKDDKVLPVLTLIFIMVIKNGLLENVFMILLNGQKNLKSNPLFQIIN